MKKKSITCLIAAISAAYVAADIPADAVPSLPGAPALKSKMWSGYLEVDNATGQNLHYVFMEAESDPANKPVVLWLNGGPGCSSMDGFMYENGPFHVSEADYTKLVVNDGRWTQSANMLWLEAPAGVGFSYAQDRSVYNTNDTQTADFNHKALTMFFEGFSEYRKNEFFIAGESYAGVYVPTLAYKTIMSQGDFFINLKGILVGNGCSGTEVGVCSADADRLRSSYLAIRNTYSPVLGKKIQDECSPDWHNPSSACQAALQQMSVEVGNINLYGIYYSCEAPIEKPNPKLTLPVAKGSVLDLLGGPVACIESKEAHAYLNSDVVTQALHVAQAKQYWQEWTICTGKINYTPTAKNLPRDVYPVLLQKGGLRVRIFNADADACVPITDAQEWTEGMGYDVANSWRSWESQLANGPIVSGYSVDYKAPNGTFSFNTVMAAGHEAPTYKPIQALDMFTRFINNKPF